MQNSSTATAAHPGHLAQPWSNPHMYPNTASHQRDPTNPRSYATGAGSAASDDQYAAYQQAAGFANVGAGYNYGGNMSNLYSTTSPSMPSGSRRTSNSKSPYQQTSSVLSSGGHSSQGVGSGQSQQYGSGYYGGYYGPEHGGHHQGGAGSQWQQHYGQPSSSGFTQAPVQGRQSSSGSMTAGGAVSGSGAGSGASNDQSQQSSRTGAGSAFDYSAAGQQGYPNWDQSRQGSNQWQQQQQPSQQSSAGGQNARTQGGSSSSQQQNVVSPWQGYGNHHPFPPPPQPVPQMGGQLPPGQYGAWNQWNGAPGAPGYYPPGTHQAQQQQQQPQQVPPTAQANAGAVPAAAASTTTPAAAPAPAAAAPTKKSSKSKKSEAAAAAAAPAAPPATAEPTEQVLGKRASESGDEHEKSESKSKSSKKNKKEEEKPAPKAPTKSHLKPPRQAPSAWQLFFTDELNKAKAAAAAEAGTTPGGTPIHPKLNVAQIAKDAGIAYANLSDERRRYYAGKVAEGKVQYQKDLIAWQATLTPEDIKTENAFRTQQRKEGKSRKGNLKDPNAPKKPLSAYFLFLKGIRENEDLKRQVWGDESETTRQSVLAAERWRGLSDDEKRPYLQQAEKDKQEYENLRKIYEDDAALRARGEAPRDRPQFAEIQSAIVEPPKSLLDANTSTKKSDGPKGDKADGRNAAPSAADPAAAVGTINPANTTFTVAHEGTPGSDVAHADTSAPGFDAPLEIEDFHGFDDMDLTGIEGMTGHGEPPEGQWDDLAYVGGDDDKNKAMPGKAH